MEIFFGIIGILIGAVIAWFIAASRAKTTLLEKIKEAENKSAGLETTVSELRKQLTDKVTEYTSLNASFQNEHSMRIKAETQLQEAQKNLTEQKQLLENASQQLKEAFNSLSAEALKSNNRAFLDLAKSSLEKYLIDAKGDLSKRQETINESLKPIKDSLEKYETHIKELEISRQSAYTGLKLHLDDMKNVHEKLQKETSALVTALKTSQVRGKYGEIGLKRVVEFAGMSEFCDFEEQVSITTDDGKLRPDLIVKLPGNKKVIVDAKVPLSAYMQAFETTDESERKTFLLKHSQAVREHLKLLSSKSYWSQFEGTPDFVVLYMQIESSFGASLEIDRTLIEDAINNRIVFATPTTFISLLRTVAFGWQQEKIAENSKKIWDAGVDLYSRISTLLEHIENIGGGLKSAVDNYNKAVNSIESRFIPGARKLKELGASKIDKELPELTQIDHAIRALPELEKNNKKE